MKSTRYYRLTASPRIGPNRGLNTRIEDYIYDSWDTFLADRKAFRKYDYRTYGNKISEDDYEARKAKLKAKKLRLKAGSRHIPPNIHLPDGW